jgi:DNA polymerase-3 subunit chi
VKQVDFYLIENSVADARLKLACRLSNKLQRMQQKTLIVTEDIHTGQQLDQFMWTFSDTSFVAHDLLDTDNLVGCAHSSVHIAEVQLINPKLLAGAYEVLINLSSKVLACSQHFSRIAEIVEADESAKADARLRFKEYKEQGFGLTTHPIKL